MGMGGQNDGASWGGWIIPLGLELLKGFALGVVADDLDVDEAAQIELLRPEHRHLDGSVLC